MGKKCRKLTLKQLLDRKKINEPTEPVWVYLDREMKENADKKPYNQKVGKWLEFMRDLHKYQATQARKSFQRIKKAAGPIWFLELSRMQKEVLLGLKRDIGQDLIENLPIRVTRSLNRLGVKAKFPKDVLLNAMYASVKDPGLFMWFLYQGYYGVSPSQLLKEYDINAMIILSSIVCIDMEECIETLVKLTVRQPPDPPKPEPKLPKYFQPKVRYGEYLQKMHATPLPNRIHNRVRPKKPPPLAYKVKLRSDESYERLCNKPDFLQKRIKRNLELQDDARVCKYKFWEAPTTLHNTDPKMAAYVQALRMFKKKAQPRYLKTKPPFNNIQCHIGNVTYSGGKPQFVLHNYCGMPTGYIPHNGGKVTLNDENLNLILGFYKFPKDDIEKCASKCDCVAKWEPTIMKHLKESKCICGHTYDKYRNKGKVKEKIFMPPTKYTPFWIDERNLYTFDPLEDFIKEKVRDAVKSGDPSVTKSDPTISVAGMKLRELLAAFLADISDTPLMIPHLPQANLIVSLQGWINRRIRGSYIPPKKHKNLLLQSQRRWRDLSKIDFRSRAYRIPFSEEELNNLTYKSTKMMKTLTNVLFDSFVTRNQAKMITQTRLWWSSMKTQLYPDKSFQDAYFAYMPTKRNDVFLVNPFGTSLTRDIGHTCPLEKINPLR